MIIGCRLSESVWTLFCQLYAISGAKLKCATGLGGKRFEGIRQANTRKLSNSLRYVLQEPRERWKPMSRLDIASILLSPAETSR